VRHRVFADAARESTFVIGTHFAAPSAGRIEVDGGGYRLES